VAGLALTYGYVVAMSLMGVDEENAAGDEAFSVVGPIVVVVTGAVLMAPVVEEVFFRGFLFGGLWTRWGWLPAALVSSLLFSLAHLSPYVVPPFAAIGFLFAWSYRKTGAITPSIIAHLMINVVSVSLGLANSGAMHWPG
jgi:membrane protease YdiL (CAAX protease family)